MHEDDHDRLHLVRTTRPRRGGAGTPRPALMQTGIVLALALCLSGTAHAVVDLSITDGTIAEVTALPSASDPGPILHSASDGFTWDSALTDVGVVWYAEYVGVSDNSSSTSETIQGSSESYISWFFGKQDANSKYSTMNATGVYDADAASYTAPALFNKDAQGTISIVSYDASSPTDGGTTTTFYWIYDATANGYVFGTTKDLSLETTVYPISNTGQLTYEKAFAGNTYVVTNVAASGADYVPTVTQGHHLLVADLPLSHTWYPLMDTPDGVFEDTYAYTLQVTAQAV